MIEIAANLLLANTRSIQRVGDEIHLGTPIASFNLPPSFTGYQEYHVVLKFHDPDIPAIFDNTLSQIFLCGKLSLCPVSNQPTITVENLNWYIHHGELPDLYQYENAQVFGMARVVQVHWHPIHERVSHLEIVDNTIKQVWDLPLD